MTGAGISTKHSVDGHMKRDNQEREKGIKGATTEINIRFMKENGGGVFFSFWCSRLRQELSIHSVTELHLFCFLKKKQTQQQTLTL